MDFSLAPGTLNVGVPAKAPYTPSLPPIVTGP
jgi:hypothetical protein